MKHTGPITQEQKRVNARDGKSGRSKGGQHHMNRFTHGMGIAHDGHGIDVHRTPFDQFKTGRRVHPGIRDDDGDGRRHSTDGDDDPRPKMNAWMKALPAVQVQSQENSLRKKRKALDGEQRPNKGPRPIHERRPE